MGYLDEMIADTRVRGLRPATARLYRDNVRQVQLFFGKRSLADLNYEDLRGYLVHMEREGRLSCGSRRIRVFALRFLYRHTLGKPQLAAGRRWRVQAIGALGATGAPAATPSLR